MDPRDYEEAIKEDAAVEAGDTDVHTHKESSTEYPNGVNVIPGNKHGICI